MTTLELQKNKIFLPALKLKFINNKGKLWKKKVRLNNSAKLGEWLLAVLSNRRYYMARGEKNMCWKRSLMKHFATRQEIWVFIGRFAELHVQDFMGQYRKNNEDFIGLHVSDTLDNLDVQDCVLAVPSSPWQLPFALGQQGKLSFF